MGTEARGNPSFFREKRSKKTALGEEIENEALCIVERRYRNRFRNIAVL
jgi:hypothetical protein